MKYLRAIGRYFLNGAIWLFDVGGNVIFFGGSWQECISSRVGRNTGLQGWRGEVCRVAEKVIDFIFGKGHCKRNIQPPTCYEVEV